jgi:hypothetical protein
MKRFDNETRDEALKEIIKPITGTTEKKSIIEELAEIPEEELAKLLELYRAQKAAE